MKIKKYGWNDFFQKEFLARHTELQPARIIIQHSNYYKVVTDQGVFLAEMAGKLEYFAKSRNDLPVIGDWVLVDIFQEDNKAVIHEVLPRKTYFSRKEAGKTIKEQVIAANIDLLFIVSGLDGEYNFSRIERFITLAYEHNLKPVLLFNKADLVRSWKKIEKKALTIIDDKSVFFLSAKNKTGFEALIKILKRGLTFVFVGSSGVGKSSIINTLLGKERLKVQEVREIDNKGRHTTSNKELICLPKGSLVIDTPGIRELGLWVSENSLQTSFEDIFSLAKQCKFRDCQHMSEPDCAVKQALQSKELSEERYKNFLKLKKEIEFIERTKDLKKANNPKKRWKTISKQKRQFRYK